MEGLIDNMFVQTLPGIDNPGVNFLATLLHPPASVLFWALSVLAILMGTVTAILYYHWLRYGFGEKMVLFAQALYTVVLLLSFIVMLTSATFYA